MYTSTIVYVDKEDEKPWNIKIYNVLALSHIKSRIDRSTFKLPLLASAIYQPRSLQRSMLRVTMCQSVAPVSACVRLFGSRSSLLNTSINCCAGQPLVAQQQPELTSDQEMVLLWAVGLLSTWHDGSAECHYTYWQHVEKVWFYHFPECNAVFGKDRALESLDEDERLMLNLHIHARRKVRRLKEM
jgi:hypothetical protein